MMCPDQEGELPSLDTLDFSTVASLPGALRVVHRTKSKL